MSSKKEVTKLRDFRIDQAFSSKAKDTPRQETMLRASTLSEWSHNNPLVDFDNDSTEILPLKAHKNLFEKPKLDSLEDSSKSVGISLTKGVAISTSHPALSWATQLAIQERQMERQGVVDVHPSLNKQELLKAKTREFLVELQDSFRENIELFNESRQSPAHHIHVYRVSQTPDDFMLYRNGIKLVVSGQRAGRILIVFNQFIGHLFSNQHQPSVELQATWGVLDQLYWTYRGERILTQDLIRYLLGEFIAQSFK